MHTTFADQLAGLDLSGFTIGPAPVTTTDFPVREEVVHHSFHGRFAIRRIYSGAYPGTGASP